LWKEKDPENMKGGHCLVKWQKCARLKKLGSLSSLEKFSKALRLRWLWYSWNYQEKPWKHLLKIIEKTDIALFSRSTIVSVGDGRNTTL
jgi:hypothetical protein